MQFIYGWRDPELIARVWPDAAKQASESFTAEDPFRIRGSGDRHQAKALISFL